jgi:hypothetical protein
LVTGAGTGKIKIRIIGGEGQDVVQDNSRAGNIKMYDTGDHTTISFHRLPGRIFRDTIGKMRLHLLLLAAALLPLCPAQTIPTPESVLGHKPGDDFFLAYSPEREDPGNPMHSAAYIPKVVGGLDPSRARSFNTRLAPPQVSAGVFASSEPRNDSSRAKKGKYSGRGTAPTGFGGGRSNSSAHLDRN